ncbi:fluoride efflux transporter FluC [Haloparvum sedimenti]|uniref:fluoride efflux transporter FluC n=1 Tax=Haloparvum sedimenti TaxID=1678448 RepID=UPI00071E95AD|nr:CrcB family protein [Haloparvum sedimenti]
MDRSASDVGLVALGGFLGATGRYGVDLAVGGVAGTFAVNVAGAFLLGLFVASVTDRRVRLLFGTGLLSSFTTYSTFAHDAVTLGTAAGAGYVAATYAVGFAAAGAGLALGGRR